MSHEFQTLRTVVMHLLPPTRSVRLTGMSVEPEYVLFQVTTTAPAASCPRCAIPSSTVHSRYQRRLTDLPWGTRPVRLQLTVRTFVCRNLRCTRRIFTERVPELVASYARKTCRLITTLQAIGVALGGQAGARLTQRLGLPTSRDTLLRLIRRLPRPKIPPLSAIGVDDWAHRKRQHYGTIVVDLAHRRPVALLHDREAETLADWWRTHPAITVIARDRMKAYRDGARAGAPQATQVADRFHLLQNLAEALDQVFSAHGPVLIKAVSPALSHTAAVQPEGQPAVPVPPSTPTPQAQTQAAQRRSRRLATDAQVWSLYRQGWSKRAMAQQLGLGRMTVVRYLQAPTFPERQGRSDAGKSVLTPYKERLLKRWNAGCREALPLFRDLRRRGYPGSSPTVARDAQRRRQAQGLQPRERRPGQTLPRVVEWQQRPLTTRRATRLVLKRPRQRTDTDRQLLAQLQSQHRDVAVAIELAQDFCALVRERQADGFDHWWARALGSGVAPLRRFATGLRADYESVKAGLRLPWSNGPVEGHINRLKRLKRQMFGRAKLDLWSRRFLRAASSLCRSGGMRLRAQRALRGRNGAMPGPQSLAPERRRPAADAPAAPSIQWGAFSARQDACSGHVDRGTSRRCMPISLTPAPPHQKCVRPVMWVCAPVYSQRMWVENGDVLGQDDLCYRATTLNWAIFPIRAGRGSTCRHQRIR
jgi:transposase